MDNKTESNKHQLLKGSINYLTWMKRIKIKLQKEGVFKTENNSRVWVKEKTLDGQSIILDNIADHLMFFLSPRRVSCFLF